MTQSLSGSKEWKRQQRWWSSIDFDTRWRFCVRGTPRSCLGSLWWWTRRNPARRRRRTWPRKRKRRKNLKSRPSWKGDEKESTVGWVMLIISISVIFIRGQFWSSDIVVACVCRCLCVSVCQSLVCLRDNSGPVQARITKIWVKGAKLELRSLLFCGAIDLDLQGQTQGPSENFGGR